MTMNKFMIKLLNKPYLVYVYKINMIYYKRHVESMICFENRWPMTEDLVAKQHDRQRFGLNNGFSAIRQILVIKLSMHAL